MKKIHKDITDLPPEILESLNSHFLISDNDSEKPLTGEKAAGKTRKKRKEILKPENAGKDEEKLVEKPADKDTVRLNLQKVGKLDTRFSSSSGPNSISKEKLVELLNTLRRYIKGKSISFTNTSDPDICSILASFIGPMKSTFSKEQLVKLYLSFTKDYNNIVEVVRSNPELTKIYKYILARPRVRNSELKERFNFQVLIVKGNYWSSSLVPEPLFIPLDFLYSDYGFYYEDSVFTKKAELILPVKNRIFFIDKLLGGLTAKPVTVSKLPEDVSLTVENFEEYIFSDLTYLDGIRLSGVAVVSPSGTVPETRLKTLVKQCATPDFIPFGNPYPLSRIRLVAEAFFSPGCQKAQNDKSSLLLSTVKFIATKYYMEIVGAMFGSFFPAYKCFRKSWTGENNRKEYGEFINNILSFAKNDWLSLAKLSEMLLCYESPTMRFTPSLFDYNAWKRNVECRDESALQPDKWDSGKLYEINLTFIRNYLKFLCGFGLLEIAENDKGEILYVRMTALGRYAFGYDKKYVEPALTVKYETDFDDAAAVMTIISQNYPYRQFFMRISNPAGPNRYAITPVSLLRECKNSSDLARVIETIGNILDVASLPHLKSIIEEARSRTNCIETTHDNFVLMKFRADVPGLRQFIVNSPRIRQDVILCEDGYILVKNHFLDEFQNILHKNGYLNN